MKKINKQNYDLVLKEAFSLFHDKSLHFLGVDLPPITSFMETQIPEVDTTNDMMDLNFRLADGSILHLEEEIHLSRSDLIRFAHYDLRLFKKYKTRIHTVVLTPAKGSPGTKVFDTGGLQYRVSQIVLKDRDGDTLFSRIESALKKGEPVNELELIFLPLMKSSLSYGELLRRTIKLENQIPEPEVRSKVRELTLILADKIVDQKILDELWEELRMFKVIKYAEEKGMKRGMEKGMEKGIEKGMEKGKKQEREIVAKNMLSLGLEDELVIKATGLDQSIIEKLKKTLSIPTQ